jgi:hypothetical protein
MSTAVQIVRSLVNALILNEIDITKIRALFDRPGSPGEKEAARAALKRHGVDLDKLSPKPPSKELAPIYGVSPEATTPGKGRVQTYHNVLSNFNYVKNNYGSTQDYSTYKRKDGHSVLLHHASKPIDPAKGRTVFNWKHQSPIAPTFGNTPKSLYDHLKDAHRLD